MILVGQALGTEEVLAQTLHGCVAARTDSLQGGTPATAATHQARLALTAPHTGTAASAPTRPSSPPPP